MKILIIILSAALFPICSNAQVSCQFKQDVELYNVTFKPPLATGLKFADTVEHAEIDEATGDYLTYRAKVDFEVLDFKVLERFHEPCNQHSFESTFSHYAVLLSAVAKKGVFPTPVDTVRSSIKVWAYCTHHDVQQCTK